MTNCAASSTRSNARRRSSTRNRRACAAISNSPAENGRRTRRLTDSDNTVTATRAQLAKLEASHAEAHSERGRLASALDEAKEQHQAERNTLTMRGLRGASST